MKISAKRNYVSNSKKIQLELLNTFMQSGIELTRSMVSSEKVRKAPPLPISNTATSTTSK